MEDARADLGMGRLVKWLLLVCGMLLLGFLVFKFVTTGRLLIEGDFNSFLYMSIGNEKSEEGSEKSMFLNRGTYIVTVEMGDGSSYATEIDVPGFLGEVKVTPRSSTVGAELITASVESFILPISGIILSSKRLSAG